MSFYISKIRLKNFKAFQDIAFTPNEKFNIIVGENNSGKSTIFEGIILWETCFKKLINTTGKSFYKCNTNRYISYQDIDFLRLSRDSDLFYKGKNATIEISVILEGEELALAIEISKPSSIPNAFFRIKEVDEAPFQRFAEIALSIDKKLDEMIFIYQTKPIASILQKEPYYNEAQIKKKILKNHSHEVLRNKIIAKRDKLEDLETNLSTILEKTIKLTIPPRTHREKEEYIHINVNSGGTYIDLHLQGSGFLQVTEIMSTIDFIDAPLKLLLVDEPDSHIHSKLQANLIKHLRSLTENQFFIISHNDHFVNNAQDGEVFFLSEDAKLAKSLKPMKIEEFDTIKKALGGVLMNLSKLNHSSGIVFVEGDDDARYIQTLINKISAITNSDFTSNIPVFFQLRGKDNIASKIEYNVRTLNGLFSDKKYGVIFDLDYCTLGTDSSLKTAITKKIKKNEPFCFSHAGYCIESTIFEDLDILNGFLFKRYILEECDCSGGCDCFENEEYVDEVYKFVSDFTNDHISTIKIDIKNVSSDLFKELEISYKSQFVNRPELSSQSFTDFTRDLSVESDFQFHRLMNKKLIKEFVVAFNDHATIKLFTPTDESLDSYASGFFNSYIDSLESLDEVSPSLIDLAKAVLRIDDLEQEHE